MSTFTMPPTPGKEDLAATWAYLEAGVELIMSHLRDGVTMENYMGIYTAVHNFCTSQKAMNSVSGIMSGGANGFASHTHRGAHLLGEDLYRNLKIYLKKHLAGIHEQSKGYSDEALLTFYIKQWDRYTTAATYTNHLFKYLNRHWVKREVDEGKKDIFDVYTLHLVSWREELFMNVHGQVMNAVLTMVEKQRNGETIEQAQIKSVVDSFVSLGLDETDSTKSTLDVYRYYFEKPFLEATEKFYEQESAQFLAENSVVEYMKKAEIRLQEEKDRVALYLHPDILPPLTKSCLNSLVSAHSLVLRDEFQRLLDSDRQEDLARMYKLLNRIQGGLDPLKAKFEAHVKKAGEEAVTKVAAEGEAALEPNVYVDALLEVHERYAKLVQEAFTGDVEFVRSLDSACKEYVNRNSVCKNTSKSPELLAKYTDLILKKSAKSSEEADLENMLVQVMVVFKFIEDKDVFQTFYSRMLAKRLVHATSASDEAEISMISKLKEACGFEYTNKLQRMFQDIQTSKDLMASYKDFSDLITDSDENTKSVEASYAVLASGMWPLTPPNTTFIPPQEVVQTYERFQSFYNSKHSGRKLSWLWHLCKGEIKANYIKSSKVPYIFQVSTYQMGILLLFNDNERVTYDEIQQTTQLAPDWLNPQLGVFVKAKVLLAEPEGAKMESGTTYALNYNFRNKKMKVNLQIAVKSNAKAEVEDTHKTIEEDRKLLMQSAIVRIMKSRKRMKHVQLVQETINQIKSRFNPKIPDIKKNIDQLIEKEYLERMDNDELGYLA